MRPWRMGSWQQDLCQKQVHVLCCSLKLKSGPSLGAGRRAVLMQPANSAVFSNQEPLPPLPAGVYVGCMYQEYASLLTDAGMKLTAATATGNSLAFMVGRVSYTFGLAGEVAEVDREPADFGCWGGSAQA